MRKFFRFLISTGVFGSKFGGTNYKLPWRNKNCWINSALQCLFKTEPLVQILKNVNPDTDLTGRKEDILTCDQIKALSLANNSEALSKTFLRNFLLFNRFYNHEGAGKGENYVLKEGSEGFVNHQRLDAAMRKLSGRKSAGLPTTFLTYFLGCFQQAFLKQKKDVVDNILDLFTVQAIRRETYTCQACGYQFDDPVKLTTQHLPQRVLKYSDILKYEKLQDFTCVTCNVPVKKKLNYLFETFPEILVIGGETVGEFAVVPDEVPVPFALENFDITPILTDKTYESVLYDLFAIIVDEGWHVWALVKDFKNGKWYQHDDYKNQQRGILENVSNNFMKDFATKGVLKKGDITGLKKDMDIAKPAVFFYKLKSFKKKV